MTKVVINTCFGGFGLSEKAMFRYAELKGLTLYRDNDWMPTYWLIPEEERVEKNYFCDRNAYNEWYCNNTLYSSEIRRDDPVLIQVVEELGKTADGEYASLKVIEIPDDIEYSIKEYDGLEHIAEFHRTWG